MSPTNAAKQSRQTILPAPILKLVPAPSDPQPLALAKKHIHFVGIGGCGMSGLARMVRQAGALCTGSDMAAGPDIDNLRSDGFSVSLDQSAQTVPADCELLVISAAIRDSHPEVAEARRRNIPIIKYAQMLGQLMIGRTGVAVSGTHGKSSTTSMLAHVLIQTGLDPSFIVGANCKQIGGGSRSGLPTPGHAGGILLAEACEFDRSFHNFHPTLAAILNVEEDHMEIYGTLDKVVEAFAVFAQKLPEASAGGSLLINHEMPHRLAITAGLNCDVQTLGFSTNADWQVESQTISANLPPMVHLFHHGEEVAQWTNAMPGEHMAYNAAAAAILAHQLGATWDAISAALSGFRGLDRRMQLLGYKHLPHPLDASTPDSRNPTHDSRYTSVTVVDDYGHHPTEIDTTLRALRRHYRPTRLICVFQPHQHSRTRFLMEQFAASFSEADVTIVPHIYFVRDSETERHAVTAGDLVDRLRQRGKQAMHLYPFGAIVEQLQLITRPGDLLVTMGAGDVWKIAKDFLQS